MKNLLKVCLLFLVVFVLFAKAYADGEGVVSYLNKDPKPYGVEREWRSCTFNTDCIAALRGCWQWEAINKKYLPDFLERNIPKCRRSTDPGLQPVTACEQMMCKATSQTTGVTGDDWLKMHWGGQAK